MDHHNLARTFQHRGRIAIAAGEIQPPRRQIAPIPSHVAPCKAGAWVQSQDLRAGCRDGIGAGRMGAVAMAIKQHPVEIFEKGIVHQPVEMAINRGVAKMGLTLGDQAQMRPTPVSGKGVTPRHARLAGHDRIKLIEGHDQRGARILKKRPMTGAECLEMPLIDGQILQPLQQRRACRLAPGAGRGIIGSFDLSHRQPAFVARRKGQTAMLSRISRQCPARERWKQGKIKAYCRVGKNNPARLFRISPIWAL